MAALALFHLIRPMATALRRLAQTLDLKDGDVLQSINGEPIDSEEAIIRIINKNRDMSTFRIGILRDGQQITRTYQMN